LSTFAPRKFLRICSYEYKTPVRGAKDSDEMLLRLTDCKERVNAVAFSPDGTILAAADHTGAITLWHAASGPRPSEIARSRTE
jgi:WD40 repeat protein